MMLTVIPLSGCRYSCCFCVSLFLLLLVPLFGCLYSYCFLLFLTWVSLFLLLIVVPHYGCLYSFFFLLFLLLGVSFPTSSCCYSYWMSLFLLLLVIPPAGCLYSYFFLLFLFMDVFFRQLPDVLCIPASMLSSISYSARCGVESLGEHVCFRIFKNNLNQQFIFQYHDNMMNIGKMFTICKIKMFRNYYRICFYSNSTVVSPPTT